MACIHLQQLYKLCETHGLRLSGADLVHVVCKQCGVQEVCPSLLTQIDEGERPASGAGSERQPGNREDG